MYTHLRQLEDGICGWFSAMFSPRMRRTAILL